jgi:PAS domain S-box-containing protein
LPRRGSAKSVHVTRDLVVDHVQDGWIILDLEDNILDVNSAAEEMLDLKRSDVLSKPITSVLTDLPNLSRALDGAQDLELRRSVRSQESWRYLTIRVSPLRNNRQESFGKLMVWSDQTKQRLAEEARHRARDEMFVLLTAISSAATNFVELDDFLSEATYQIIHPFQSQLVAIFLLDEGDGDREKLLRLASHLGLPDEAIASVASLPASGPLMDSLEQVRQPAAIDDPAGDMRTPVGLTGLGFSHLLFSPMITTGVDEARIIGLVCLGRRDPPGYSADELARMAEVAEQMATLIDSTRRSKLSIALSERQNLIKDLHDSVSQKLYGLVTMTEAAHASLEAGGSIDLNQLLTRMGESARQAAREMRLFLYQLRPADIEKEGLVGAIHHRLSAVEGRASVKARLLADDGIMLSKDKEVALCYIAQEALNNIIKRLRHSVLVTLRRTARHHLEVRDDGRVSMLGRRMAAEWGSEHQERAAQVSELRRVPAGPGRG